VRYSAARIVDAAGGAPVLDVGCGWGSNAIWLAQLGAAMICIDRDLSKIESQSLQLCQSPRKDISERLILRQLDLVKDSWPFGPRTVGGIINVHCFLPSLLRCFEHSLSPGGYLCLETPQGHGRNYFELPKAGEIRRLLERGFDFEVYEERPVGPTSCNAVTVRLLAKKKAGPEESPSD
jgi:hypothetical protein